MSIVCTQPVLNCIPPFMKLYTHGMPTVLQKTYVPIYCCTAVGIYKKITVQKYLCGNNRPFNTVRGYHANISQLASCVYILHHIYYDITE